MDSMNTPSNLYALEVDEATLLGHRLLKAFHRLRLTRHREQTKPPVV